VEIRTACRLAFIQAGYEDGLRRAEIRQYQACGPFVVGQWVLFNYQVDEQYVLERSTSTVTYCSEKKK
jgi:hypothetical protein